MIKMFFEIFAILMIAAAAMIIYNSRAAAESDQYYIMCHARGEVNGRERPSKHSPVSCRFFPGDEVKIDYDSAGHGWCHVADAQNESGECWVKSAYVVRGPYDAYPAGVRVQVAASGRVAVRVEPSKASERVKWVQPGDMVTVYAVTPEWCDVGDGYIMTQYLHEAEN